LRIEKHYGDEFYGSHVVNGIRTCAPIRNWSATDTITYLVRNDVPWKSTYDYGNSHLLNLYGSAMGGLEECSIGAAIQSDKEAIRSCVCVCGVIFLEKMCQNTDTGMPEIQRQVNIYTSIYMY
jgi:3'-phosphoadenosine 5'-phosphosulfate sulfotransferase (PAPS reductase)/FAD synthetase